jgi:hypothetical protein
VIEIGLETELEVDRPSSFPSTPVVADMADCGIVDADSAKAVPDERPVLVLPQPELEPAWLPDYGSSWTSTESSGVDVR